MSDDTAPLADRQHARPLLRLALEVLLIAAGVFLGLAGDQWRENASHRALARETLRRFRAEIAANRAAVAAVRDYHVTTLRDLRKYLSTSHATRNVADVHLRGLRGVPFEHTAWDLAMSAQALSYVPPDVAVELSRVYNKQQAYAQLSQGVTQSMYLLPRWDNFDGLASAAEVYFSDLVVMEPELLAAYDRIVPHIDAALRGR
ncbi:hypothetical protein J421_0635 [Gemmatirosa kalamazoonensis]|uniref:Uncharacterized protein n=1 Tax=Gemmatirosa kalamazoonensis TaxID=861299 RepID=W0RCK8_9BACT|nr:hypothetical protein [Gemmatirosa kalamazoonensis]AHG88172.1 hypothetical protein J421_0635 [Gemmatirosa kalamazoonensis]